MKLLAALFIFSCLTWAAGIDGKWTSEVKARAGKKGGAARTATMIMDLKTSGGQLTGTVLAQGRKRSRPVAIQDGKIDGDRFSFTTVQRTKRAETKTLWQGTVQGDKMTGTFTRETQGKANARGRRRGTPFTASRQA